MGAIRLQPLLIPLERGNAALNSICDFYTDSIAVPAIKGTYNLVGSAVAAPFRLISKSHQKRVKNAFKDPISSQLALRIARVAERITLYLGTRNPIPLPGLRYVDTCLISSFQSLHRFCKESRYLLRVPYTLRTLVSGISPGKTVDRLLEALGERSEIIAVGILKVKQAVLLVVAFILSVIDEVLRFFLMESKYGTLTYLRQIINKTREKAQSTFREIAFLTIESQEKGIRQSIVKKSASGTLWWTTSMLSRMALKTGLGLLGYLSLKDYIHHTHKVPPSLIHLVAIPIIGKALWDTVFYPLFHPYYENYEKNYTGDGNSLKYFLEYWGFGALHLPLSISRSIMYLTDF